jgi:hypothetical protein
MSSINITDIIGQLQAGQNSANAANQQRYQQGMGVLGRSAGQARGYYDEALRQSKRIGRKSREDVNKGAQRLGAKQTQNLISSGLGNTTIMGSMMRGVEAERQSGLLAAREASAGRQMGLAMDRGGLEYDIGGRKADYIASRYDNAPDPAAYTGLMQQAAAATQMPSNANPVTVSGGLGPMASAGMTATGGIMGSNPGFGGFGPSSGSIGGGNTSGGSAQYFGPGQTPGQIQAPPTAPATGMGVLGARPSEAAGVGSDGQSSPAGGPVRYARHGGRWHCCVCGCWGGKPRNEPDGSRSPGWCTSSHTLTSSHAGRLAWHAKIGDCNVSRRNHL